MNPIPDLNIETERLLIVTVSNEYNGDKHNLAIEKSDVPFSLKNYFENPSKYKIIGYINIDRNSFIEYEVYKFYRQQGYAKEMLSAVKEYLCKLDIYPKLYIDELNVASKSVAEKCGFQNIGKYNMQDHQGEWRIKK